jgi:hypothetical protein
MKESIHPGHMVIPDQFIDHVFDRLTREVQLKLLFANHISDQRQTEKLQVDLHINL